MFVFVKKHIFLYQISDMTPEIYKAIRNRIKEKFPTDYVDLYLEQYDDTANNPLWTASAWLIEFMPIEWEEQGKEVQGGFLEFVVHHVSETGYDDERRMTGLVHWTNDAECFKNLHKFSCNLQYIGINSTDPLIATIQRTSSEMSSRMQSVIVTKQRFSR